VRFPQCRSFAFPCLREGIFRKFATALFCDAFFLFRASPSDVLLVLFFSLCFVSGEIFEHQSIFLIETFQKDEDDNEYERAWRQSGRRRRRSMLLMTDPELLLRLFSLVGSWAPCACTWTWTVYLSIALQLQFSGFTIASSVQCFTISLLDVHDSTHSASLRSTLLHTLSYSRCFSPLFFSSFLASDAIANPQNLHSVVPYRSVFACPCAPCVRIPVVLSGFLLLSSSYSSVSWEVRLSSSVALTFHNFGLLIRIILSSDSLVTQGFACKNSARSGWFGWRNKNSVPRNHKVINLCWQIWLESAPKIIEKHCLGWDSSLQAKLRCFASRTLIFSAGFGWMIWLPSSCGDLP